MTGTPRTIALDTTYRVGRNLSGVGIYSREIADGLARAHPETDFLYCYRPHRFLRDLAIPGPRNAHKRLLWNGWPRSFDLFHGLNQRLEKRYRRGVATFHDLFVLTGEYSTPEFRLRFAEQARQAADLADLIIAVSESTAVQVVELLHVPRSRIRVIPHGVRNLHAASAAHSTRENLVLFVGAIQKRKNVLRLVQAFERTPVEWKLVLAGSMGYGSGDVVDAVEQSSRRADITMAGYVSDEQLETLYRRASIFAFPSLDEGFGIPILEAMSRGVPVLTSNQSALPEVAGDAALVVDPNEVEAITQGLNRLIKDEELRQTLSLAGIRRSSIFTWERSVAATWEVYEELLG